MPSDPTLYSTTLSFLWNSVPYRQDVQGDGRDYVVYKVLSMGFSDTYISDTMWKSKVYNPLDLSLPKVTKVYNHLIYSCQKSQKCTIISI